MRILFFVVLASILLRVSSFAQETLSNSIGMEFVLIKPGRMTVGEFQPPYPVPEDTVRSIRHPYIMWMGEGRGYSAEEFRRAKELALRDASPGFKVNIEKAFYIGKFEVTQGQWKRVMGNNLSTFQDGEGSDKRPVENVSWEDAQRFILALNKLEKTKCYRLPTEFEWEYAARSGAEKDIPWPDIQSMANLNKTHTLPVGKMKPNNWGLYDMLGNVWEWVEDYHNGKIFADPTSPRKGSHRVLKGASFAGDVKNATYMTHAAGPGNGWDVGFRIVKMIDQK